MTFEMIRPGMILSTNGLGLAHPETGLPEPSCVRVVEVRPGDPAAIVVEPVPGDHDALRPKYALAPFVHRGEAVVEWKAATG